MSSYQSNRGGVQVYRRFCFGAIFSGILCLGVVAIFVLLFFQPIFWLQQIDADGEIVEQFSWTGLDFVYYVLRRWFPQVADEQCNILNNYVADYAGNNTMFMFVRNFAMYIEIVLLAFLAIATIFALVIGICGILYIFTGRNTNTKLASSLSKSAFIFYALFVGLLLLFAYIVQSMVMDDTGPQDATVRFALLPLIMGGVFLAIAIALAITYRLAFKNKVFASKKKSKNDEEDNDVETFNPRQSHSGQAQSYSQGQTVIIQQAATDNSYRLPEGVREIGDHAFAKNLSLKEATIPYGVPGLGPAAFSNCLALEKVIIPFSVKDIGYNCFFNTPKLKKIIYLGTVKDWKRVKRGSNWLARSGTRVIEASDGRIVVYR